MNTRPTEQTELTELCDAAEPEEEIADVEESEPVVAAAASDVDVLALFRTFRASRDIALRDQLVSRYLHLVQSIARRFSGMGESLDDLVQEGSIGLLNAVDLFDPERGVKFSTYACHLITSQIQHYLRDRGRLIRQPAWVQELNTKVTRATEQLAQALGRDPSPAEVAERLNISEDSVNNVLAARELNHVISLTAPSDGSGETDLSLLDKDKVSTTKIVALQLPVEDRIVLDEAISGLKELEQKVVRLFFFGDLNQTEIARKLGISVNYSSYLLRRAVGKIKTFMEEQLRHEHAALVEPDIPVVPAPLNIPTYDPISGVYSGAYLRMRVAEEIARSRRYPTNFALMLAGTQGFDEVDEEMHKPLLSAIGQMLRVSTRIVDLTAHLGDGMFGLLLPHTGREARVLGDRLCCQIATRELLPPAQAVSLAFNVGYAVFPMEGATVEMLFDRAEYALTLAAKAGPGVVMGVPMPRIPLASK